MNGKYAIVLKSQMGLKRGFITLMVSDKIVEGILECLGNENHFKGKVINSNKMQVEGMLNTPLGEVPFMIAGRIEDNMMTATFNVKNEKYELLGLKLSDKEGK
jgi:hypothetical protein